MKKYFFAALLIPMLSTAQDTQNFAIKGSYTNISMPVKKVMMYYRLDDKNMTDSAEPKNGNYVFSAKLREPMIVTLRAVYEPGTDGKPVRTVNARDMVNVFVVPGTVDVTATDSFANTKVTGSKMHDAYLQLRSYMKPLVEKRAPYIAAYNKANAEKDAAAKKAAIAKLDSLDLVEKKMYGEFVKNNTQSPIALYALNQFAGWDIDVEAVEPLFAKLPEEQKKYASAKTLLGKIEIAKKTSIGKIALDFAQNDTLDVPVKLSAFRGKYLLVDFWASWCVPCREENPNVVKAFNEFKDKNFYILGVSLDRPGAKQDWLDAIHKDNLTWAHVSDLKWWQNDVAKLYGIQAIPQNLLLDPNGKIIAKNLDGEKLRAKLNEIFHP
jgi:peroxiredoxin